MQIRFGWVLKNTIIVLFIVFMILAAIEAGVRLVFADQMPRPISQVIWLDPDPLVGWHHPDNFEYQWEGRIVDCPEFSVPIRTNRWGYRGADWTIEKSDKHLRVAVIGDSFVEALQVPDEQTAVGVLESLLQEQYPDYTIEVMNFGVSGYGVGQYELVYQHHVQQFQPDYVFVFLAYLHMWRTSALNISGALSDDGSLQIRPTYIFDENGNLQFVEAPDYERYVQVIQELIDTKFGEDRTSVIEPKFTLQFMRYLSFVGRPIHEPVHERDANQSFEHADLNYAILEKLSEEVSNNGSQMIFVDIFDYLENGGKEQGSGILESRNQTFASEKNIGYINLSERLRAATERVTFACDGHFNTLGNRIFAETMFDWMQVNVQQ